MRCRLQLDAVGEDLQHRRNDVGGHVDGDGRLGVAGDERGDGVVTVVQGKAVDTEEARRVGRDVSAIDRHVRAERGGEAS